MRSDPYRLWGKETRWVREADGRFVPYEDAAPAWARWLAGAAFVIVSGVLGFGLGWTASMIFDLVVRRGS